MNSIKIIIIFLIAISNIYSQLLRPTYKIPCPDYPTQYLKENLSFIINEKPKNDLQIKIINPNQFKIDTTLFINPSKLLDIYFTNDSTINIIPINPKIENKERCHLIVLGKNIQQCIDTIMNISLLYNAQLYKKVKFFGRLELGYLYNNITFSDRSILTNERYLEEGSSGFQFGCEIVEYRATSDFLYFGMSLGLNSYWYNLKYIKNDSITGQISSKDLLFNFRGDLPFYFIQRELKDLSLRLYLSFPFLYTGSLSPGLNDINNLKLYFGFGLNYNLSKWFAMEIKSSMMNYESHSSKILSGSKINYNTLKSEFIFSIINVYDNLNELLSN